LKHPDRVNETIRRVTESKRSHIIMKALKLLVLTAFVVAALGSTAVAQAAAEFPPGPTHAIIAI